MRSYISDIILFSEDGDKRTVSFDNGLNIITGDSKTGKSAIIEIVDFCLFSARSTIPVGKVTEWTNLFCVVYNLPGKKLIVARSGSANEKSKGYIGVELEQFDIERFLTKDYVESLPCKNIKLVQKDFEQHFGLSVASTKTSDEQSPQTGSKASIRDCASVMFQHQNLIANKHSLFYRFDDFYKRSKIISDFPIHLGWADGKYYSLIREQEKLLKDIRKSKKTNKQKSSERETLRLSLLRPIEVYYKALGLVLEEKDRTLVRLKKIANGLPKIPINAYERTDLGKQLKQLKSKRGKLYNELTKTNNLIEKVESGSGEANEYSKSIGNILELSEIESNSADVICPVCHTEKPNVIDTVKDVLGSRNYLLDELSKVGSFKQDNTGFYTDLLRNRDEIKIGISEYTTQINHLNKAAGVDKDNEVREQLIFLNGRIANSLETTMELIPEEEVTSKHGELAARLEDVESQLAEYDLKDKIKKANQFINETMNELKEDLDFEDELKPGEMRFDLENFNFIYRHNNKDINLSEMGSGANWLACHLCLFLALLKLSCKENSTIPKVLFIDQPSQVYFPKTNRRISSKSKLDLSKIEDKALEKIDENIEQVIKLFTVIDKFLLDMEKDKDIGFKPQVVVLEHADEPELDEYIVERWSKDGKKLI